MMHKFEKRKILLRGTACAPYPSGGKLLSQTVDCDVGNIDIVHYAVRSQLECIRIEFYNFRGLYTDFL